MTFPAKEFTGAGLKPGLLSVARNMTRYTEDNVLSIITYDSDGKLKSNLTFDLHQTNQLRELLTEIVKANEDQKPKEPTIPEQIEAMRVGTIFGISKRSGALFIRTTSGTRLLTDPKEKNYPFSDYGLWDALYIRFDPNN